MSFGIDNRTARPFIERMRNDPRMRAMVDGWIAQATATVELRRDMDRDNPRQIAHETAKEALRLALSFILDQDGEYQMLAQERDKLLENSIEMLRLQPAPMIVRAADMEQ